MPRLKLGLVLDREHHEGRRWVSALTPRLVDRIQSRFDCVWIQHQKDYEDHLGDVDALLSMEPGWAAPRLDFARSAALRAQLARVPSYITYSDPHDKAWRQDYFLDGGIDFCLAYYRAPTLHHFNRLPPERVIHFPWAVPDEWIGTEHARFRAQPRIAIFGASHHEAYEVRNWCRSFAFVDSTANSGVENKAMTDEEYIAWLATRDAAIAAGSEDPRYRLTVPKYFEIAAAGCLLFAQETDDLGVLGFTHLENCVVFSQRNFEALARDYLSRPQDFQSIRSAGRELVRSRHSLSRRIEELERHMLTALDRKGVPGRRSVWVGEPAVQPILPADATSVPPSPSGALPDLFDRWFEKICLPELLPVARSRPLSWQGRTLAWEVCHEILAFERFTGGDLEAERLIQLSNDRYAALDGIWPGSSPTRDQLDTFYLQSAEILPWGHGVFLADHDVEGRRANWLRRVALLLQLRASGVATLADYGGGGGHTSLLARAMGFDLVIHHEYDVFHPYVRWRANFIEPEAPDGRECRFMLTRGGHPFRPPEPLDAVLCSDVAEHVHDPAGMLEEVSQALNPGGHLVWVARFEENIAGHLHPELRGQEDRLLADAGFEKEADLPVDYEGHTGLYRKKARSSTRLSPAPATARPRILFLVDVPGWAHDFKTSNLQRLLGSDYEMRKCFHDEVSAEALDWADLIVVYYWMQIAVLEPFSSALERNRHKLLIGICSHHELREEQRARGLEQIGRWARAVFVNNLALYREFESELAGPVFYTPNGVDTEFYTPLEQRATSDALRVGWAGSLSNHGCKRGYEELIVPAVGSVAGAQLVTAAREERWRGPEEMREFYRSLDVYVCASRTEGTPNPCLEAAACGVPIVSTPVGNMPELINDGENGLLIRRSVEALVEKLELLRDNPRLRGRLARASRETIESWDWSGQAENYRAMFDAVLAADLPRQPGSAPFLAPSQLYVASADRMDRVLENMATLKRAHPREIDDYATVVGGLSGLNYLSVLRPRQITFYDVNLAALDHARLMIELIGICDTPEELIGRIFGRPLRLSLVPENQQRYLATPVDQAWVAETLERLSPDSRMAFRRNIVPHLAGQVLDGVRNCRRLLPCWPVDERVPVGAGEAAGCDERGDHVPNINTFFFGEGWLATQETFDEVRRNLQRADLRFVFFDLLHQDLRCLGDLSGALVLHVSNIDDWFPENWPQRLAAWQLEAGMQQGRLTVITSHNGVLAVANDPHRYAFLGLAPYVQGRVVEVTHKVPWGFDEIERTNVTAEDYLVQSHPTDTTILHILVGEGVPRETFHAVYQRALQQSSRVLVLEHDRESSDWAAGAPAPLLDESQLREAISRNTDGCRSQLTAWVRMAGETDGHRNMLAVVDVHLVREAATHG